MSPQRAGIGSKSDEISTILLGNWGLAAQVGF